MGSFGDSVNLKLKLSVVWKNRSASLFFAARLVATIVVLGHAVIVSVAAVHHRRSSPLPVPAPTVPTTTPTPTAFWVPRSEVNDSNM
jgi:hypothetical protein